MPRRRILLLLATTSLTLAALAAAGAAEPSNSTPERGKSPTLCAANVMHPIQVHVAALDPIQRGANVRLQVTASSARGLGRAEILMLSDGGARRLGATRFSLGTLAPGRRASGIFTVNVPRAGNRFYVQFQVTGDGPQGMLTRGACYNILPDGPLETGRVVTTPEGGRVIEVAARRID
jgi:hypothetical protein